MDYISQVNAPALFLIVGAILFFIIVMCVIFLVRSYRAGIAIGMDPKVLKKTVVTSAVFTILPSVGILVGVITLSGTLGIPLSWLRLSVVGALQYELSVAEISAEAIGLSGLKVSELSIGAFTTISLVMTVGILGGGLCTLFFLGKYLKKVYRKPKAADAKLPEETAEPAGTKKQPENSAPKKKNNLGSIAMVAMFIGLCTAYISSYFGELVHHGEYQPLFTAGAAGLIMVVFTLLGRQARFKWLEDFDVALSMLLAMGAVCVLNLWV